MWWVKVIQIIWTVINLQLLLDLCGREMSCKKLYDKHLKTHRTKNPFKCVVCGISYIHQSTLSRHSKIHGKQFDCTVCTMKFPYDSHLRRHLLQAHDDVDGINQPRALPEEAPKRKKKKPKIEVSSSDQTSSESTHYEPQAAPVITNSFRPYHSYWVKSKSSYVVSSGRIKIDFNLNHDWETFDN